MPDLSITIISDSHVTVRKDLNDPCWWNKMLLSRSGDILATAVDDANNRGQDIVVHCGDISHLSDPESFQAAFDILSKLECPFYFAPGNHDTYIPEARRVVAKLAGLEKDVLYRAVEVNGWRLIFIDCMYWLRKDGSVAEFLDLDQHVDFTVPEFEVDWLKNELDRDPDQPTLCFAHPVMASKNDYDIARMPKGKPVTKRPVTFEPYFGATEKLRDLLKSYACIKAVFYGHGHVHDCIVDDGRLYCQTGSLIEYPNEVRYIKISDDGIEVETIPLSCGDFADASYVPEWGNKWVRGRAVDRKMYMPFKLEE